MNEKSTPEESGSHRNAREKSGTPYIEVSGSQATRELRDTSRRRREAEEKLQQHLMEAKEHANEDGPASHGKAQDSTDAKRQDS